MLKNDVLNYFKDASEVAKLLNLTRGAVSQWSNIIPEKNAYRLQEITNGALKVDHSLYRK